MSGRTRAVWLCLLALALPTGARGQAIDFKDFGSDKGLTLNGSAKVTGADAKPAKTLRLTPSEETQAGSAFFTERVALKNGFETTFQFQITDPKDAGLGLNKTGADGFAFVIQNSSAKALGSPGSGLGYAPSDDNTDGIAKSVAIEFDTFTLKDLSGDDPLNDPNGNHISVHSRGTDTNDVDEAYSLGKVWEKLPDFKDGRVHKVKVAYTPGTLKVYIDDMKKEVLSAAIKLDSFSGKGFSDKSVLDSDGKAWVGFTAGTGGAMENHDILSWKMKPGAPAAGK